VARLFVGSLTSEKVVQDFRLTCEPCSLVDIGGKVGGKRRDWAMLLHNNSGLNVFNSTTVYSWVLAHLIDI
jgi:hypothetical protein